MITDDHKDKERKNSAPRTPPDPVVSTQAPGQYTATPLRNDPTISSHPRAPAQYCERVANHAGNTNPSESFKTGLSHGVTRTTTEET